MKGIKEYLNEEEKKEVEMIETYLELNGFRVISFRDFINFGIEGKKNYKYIYEKIPVRLKIECSFYQSKLENIHISYRRYENLFSKNKVLYNIKEIKDFLFEIL